MDRQPHRITGPYQERGRYRIRWFEGEKGRSQSFDTEEQARAQIKVLRGDDAERKVKRVRASKGTATWWQTKLANAAERVERSITDEALAARTLATLAKAAGKFVDIDKLQRQIEQLEQIAEKAEKAMDKGRVH